MERKKEDKESRVTYEEEGEGVGVLASPLVEQALEV